MDDFSFCTHKGQTRNENIIKCYLGAGFDLGVDLRGKILYSINFIKHAI